MRYELKLTKRFKRDFKMILKSGYDISFLQNVIDLLATGKPLPEKHRDHSLTGNWVKYRECHIAPDWLLIYRIEEDILILTLTRTGSHSNLF
ncbi:MAG: type II toxin-antitoxin system YafQ family toxin [Holosporales bacterium]|jgi:mRNA interferase YafQ|nr:type II toxin-antitoxin system YafQ family toxin [Holosporales bacterium]